MSYSFTVTATSKEAAKIGAAKAFDEMALQQPMHKRDREAALASANAVIDLLVDDPEKAISVSMSGYVSWRGVPEPDDSNELSGVSVSASASLVMSI